ncbi:MAG: hypothetical protein AAF633_04590, partial [Chloroflexota bacterium]
LFNSVANLGAGDPSLTGSITLATITFSGSAEGTSNLTLAFKTGDEPKNAAIASLNAQIVSSSITVTGAVTTSLTGTVNFEGYTDNSGEILSVRFFASGASTPAYAFTPTTSDAQGTFLVSDIEPGDYSVEVKLSNSLQKALNMTIVSGSNSQDFGTLLAGDSNNNNTVEISDFSILASSFNKSSGDVGYVDGADFTGDNIVNLGDFSLLANNFNTSGEGTWND